MSIYTLDRPDFAPIVINYPSRPLYGGESIVIEIDSGSVSVAAGSEENLISVTGAGKFVNALIMFKPDTSLANTMSLVVRIYLDGSRRVNLTLNEIEAWIGHNLYNKLAGATATDYYYPDWINPIITPIMGHYDSTNDVIDSYYLMLNFVMEFTESFTLAVYNPLTTDIVASCKALVGYYP